MFMRRVSTVVCVLMLAAFSAGAWSAVGHKAVAEIAWRQMDRKEKTAVSRLLKKHPHYKQLLAVDVPRGMDVNHWAFLNAAIWPDLLRSAKSTDPADPEFYSRHNIYPHATLLPVVRKSDESSVSLDGFNVPTPNATIGLSNSLARIGDKKLSAQERALSLAWTLHLLADLHQPLHASTLVTRNKPKGNDAGGSLWVREPKGDVTNLHAYWDRIPGTDRSYETIAAFADLLSKDPALAANKLDEYGRNKSVASWAEEGRAEAARCAYAEGKVDFALKADVESGAVARSAIPTLTPQYIDEARTVAHRRLALSAHRLTDALKSAF